MLEKEKTKKKTFIKICLSAKAEAKFSLIKL